MFNKIKTVHQALLRKLNTEPQDSQQRAFFKEFLCFGYKEAISCLFPAYVFIMLALTRFVEVPGIARYDLMLVACLLMQILMYVSGLESKREVLVICAFHFLGISMEMFKVAHGSWAYPSPALTKIYNVPLYSGFMYASVASYICQAWRNFDLKFVHWPSLPISTLLAILIYGNFFTNRYIPDLRMVIFLFLAIAFFKTSVLFNTNGRTRAMPMLLSFFLIAIFIWIGENICTFLGAWHYPHQKAGWSVVKLQIMSSWFLLVIVSVIIVAILKSCESQWLSKQAGAGR